MNYIQPYPRKSKNKRIASYVSFTILFFLMVGVFSQVIEEWASRYNGTGNGEDTGEAIAVDVSGNVYVTGYSSGPGTYWDCVTIKYNSAGVEQWAARYNGTGSGYDWGKDIAVDDSGNVYVTGISFGSGASDDCVTIKYNSAGVEQWVARYDGIGGAIDAANAIAVDSAGNVYITGITDVTGSMDIDCITIKYNSVGTQQWAVRYNGSANGGDGTFDIAVDSSGNVYVTGTSDGIGTDNDYITIKYNSSGIQQWAARYNGPMDDTDSACALAIDNSGNVYITGTSIGAAVYNQDYATIKYNSAGVEQWVTRYNNGSNDDVEDLAMDNSGNIYVIGASYGSGTNRDYATVKYNNSGVEQWVARFDGASSGDDLPYAITVDNWGNVYVTGESYFPATHSFDYTTIKYDTSGVQQWLRNYDGTGNDNDLALDIAVDDSGNAYITGRSSGSGTDYDYATVKYAPVIASSETFYVY